MTNQLLLLSAWKADNEVDNGVLEFANKDDLGNPLSNDLDGKKLLNAGDKAK